MKAVYPIFTDQVVAGAALVQGRFVKIDGTVPAAGDRCLGIARTGGLVGDYVPVDVFGVVEVEAGAAFAKGAELQADAAGRAITKAAGAKTAVALEAATAANQVVLAFVQLN